MNRRHLLFFVANFLVAGPVHAQAVASKEPTSTHIFPAGGRRGTVVPVRVGAECLPPGARFILRGDGVQGPDVLGRRAMTSHEPSPRRLPLDANFINYPKEWESEIRIGAHAPLGPCWWRVATAWGGTQMRPFLVGDLPEHIEKEPNSTPSLAERIELPVVVNGQIAGERDIDYFIFAAKAGETVVCDVMAARIGSPLDPLLELQDTRGHRLQPDEVRIGNDPVVAFRVPADGDYSLRVSNLGVGGGPEYVYRITISTAAYHYSAFPPGGRAGEMYPVEFLALTGTGKPQLVSEKVAISTVAKGLFWHHGTPGRNPVLLAAGALSEVSSATDGNRTADTAMNLTLPVTVNGRFRNAAAEDWYRFVAKAGEAFAVDCRPFPPGSPAVPVLTIQDEKGVLLARASGSDTPGHSCTLEWRAPANGAYFLRLRDLQHGSQGGSDFVYRLTLRPAQADFSLTLVRDYINVTQGARAELEVIVTRTGGFTDPIQLQVSGLPQGVRVENIQVPANVSRHRVALVAAADARPTDATLRIVGTASIGGSARERTATVVPLGLEVEGLSLAAPALPTVELTVQHKPLFRLTCSEAYQYAHRGTIYPYRMQVERLNGFEGEIRVQICDRQVQDLDGIEVVEQAIPRGAKEFDNLLYFPESMHASVQHHSRPYVQGYATFVDRWGQPQTLMALSDRRCMVRTRPPVAKLRAVEETVQVSPDNRVECKLVLDRTSNFTGAMQIELIDAPPGARLIAAETAIRADANTTIARVDLGQEARRRALAELKFRASGKIAGGATVISEVVVKLQWP